MSGVATSCWPITPTEADFILGNPPYIRLENIPTERSAAYRRACPTMRGRSDIYVGFIETCLRILKPDGVLGFIVADRWMHNQYGADLRQIIADGYSVETVLTMHDVDAFEAKVSAYPAITVIRRGEQSTAVVANATRDFDEALCTLLHEVDDLPQLEVDEQSTHRRQAPDVVRLVDVVALR